MCARKIPEIGLLLHDHVIFIEKNDAASGYL